MVHLHIALGIDPFQFLADAFGEVRGVGNQRKTFSIPNPLVKLRGLGGSKGKHKPIENDFPDPWVDINDSGISKEIPEILS
jgi:hypothetical protein